MGVARSTLGVSKYPMMVNWKDTDRTIPWYRNTVKMPPRTTTPVRIGTGPLVSPTRMGSQDIGIPMWFIGPQESRND